MGDVDFRTRAFSRNLISVGGGLERREVDRV